MEVVRGLVEIARGAALGDLLRVTLDDAEAEYTPAVLAGHVRLRGSFDGGALALDWSTRRTRRRR